MKQEASLDYFGTPHRLIDFNEFPNYTQFINMKVNANVSPQRSTAVSHKCLIALKSAPPLTSNVGSISGSDVSSLESLPICSDTFQPN